MDAAGVKFPFDPPLEHAEMVTDLIDSTVFTCTVHRIRRSMLIEAEPLA